MQHKWWIRCQVALQAPTLLYGGLAAGIGISKGHWTAAVAFATFNILLLLATSIWYSYKINTTYQ